MFRISWIEDAWRGQQELACLKKQKPSPHSVAPNIPDRREVVFETVLFAVQISLQGPATIFKRSKFPPRRFIFAACVFQNL